MTAAFSNFSCVQSNLSIVFICVSCEEKGYCRAVLRAQPLYARNKHTQRLRYGRVGQPGPREVLIDTLGLQQSE